MGKAYDKYKKDRMETRAVDRQLSKKQRRLFEKTGRLENAYLASRGYGRENPNNPNFDSLSNAMTSPRKYQERAIGYAEGRTRKERRQLNREIWSNNSIKGRDRKTLRRNSRRTAGELIGAGVGTAAGLGLTAAMLKRGRPGWTLIEAAGSTAGLAGAGALAGGSIGKRIDRKKKRKKDFSLSKETELLCELDAMFNQVFFSRGNRYNPNPQPRNDYGEFEDSGDIFWRKRKSRVLNPNYDKKLPEDPALNPRTLPDERKPLEIPEVRRYVTKKGKQVHRWSARGTNMARDLNDVVHRRPRRKDKAGREKKREWEKPWVKKAVGTAAGTAAVIGTGIYLAKNPKARNKVRRAGRKIKSWRDQGWSMIDDIGFDELRPNMIGLDGRVTTDFRKISSKEDSEKRWEPAPARKRRVVGAAIGEKLDWVAPIPVPSGIGKAVGEYVGAPAAYKRRSKEREANSEAYRKAAEDSSKHISVKKLKTSAPIATTYKEHTSALKKQKVGLVQRHASAIGNWPNRYLEGYPTFVPRGKEGVIASSKKNRESLVLHQEGRSKDYIVQGGRKAYKKTYKKGHKLRAKNYIKHNMLPEDRAWDHAEIKAGKNSSLLKDVKKMRRLSTAQQANEGYLQRRGRKDQRSKVEKAVDIAVPSLAAAGLGYLAVKKARKVGRKYKPVYDYGRNFAKGPRGQHFKRRIKITGRRWGRKLRGKNPGTVPIPTQKLELPMSSGLKTVDFRKLSTEEDLQKKWGPMPRRKQGAIADYVPIPGAAIVTAPSTEWKRMSDQANSVNELQRHAAAARAYEYKKYGFSSDKETVDFGRMFRKIPSKGGLSFKYRRRGKRGWDADIHSGPLAYKFTSAPLESKARSIKRKGKKFHRNLKGAHAKQARQRWKAATDWSRNPGPMGARLPLGLKPSEINPDSINEMARTAQRASRQTRKARAQAALAIGGTGLVAGGGIYANSRRKNRKDFSLDKETVDFNRLATAPARYIGRAKSKRVGKALRRFRGKMRRAKHRYKDTRSGAAVDRMRKIEGPAKADLQAWEREQSILKKRAKAARRRNKKAILKNPHHETLGTEPFWLEEGAHARRRYNRAKKVRIGRERQRDQLNTAVQVAKYGGGAAALTGSAFAGAHLATSRDKRKRRRQEELSAMLDVVEFDRTGGYIYDEDGNKVYRYSDVRGNSARIHYGDKKKRDRRKKRWHERIENERKLRNVGTAAAFGLGILAGSRGPSTARRVSKRVSKTPFGKEMVARKSAWKNRRSMKRVQKKLNKHARKNTPEGMTGFN